MSSRATAVFAVLALALLAVGGIAAAGVTVPAHDLLDQPQRFAVVIAAVVLGLTCGCVAVLRPSVERRRRLALLSAMFSLLCLAGTVYVWAAVGSDNSLKLVPGTPVSTAAEAHAYLDRHHEQAVRRIPTGVLIETMQFGDANNVKVTGFVWQRLPLGTQTEKPLVELPGAVDGGVADLAYHGRSGNTLLVGWRLRATLRERFDYRHYPLDRQAVWMVMWPSDHRSALVPDFSAYPPWRTHQRMGLYRDLVSDDWNTLFTTYAMHQVDDQTNYGRDGVAVTSSSPELHFTVGLSRNFFSPLLDRLTPLIVIACLVFASLFVVTKDDDRRSLAGFSTWTVLGFCGAMMLVIAVQHSSLRAATGSSSVVYAEYFYFILYIVIALTALNVVEYTGTSKLRFLAWRGNLAARLLYWPITLGLLLLATLVVFLL